MKQSWETSTASACAATRSTTAPDGGPARPLDLSEIVTITERLDRLTVFVGAGISKPPPTDGPDFRDLRNYFLRLADPTLDPKEFDLDELSPEQVFGLLDDGREETRASVRRELWWLCEPREPNANHYAVAALAGAGARVWTPNFDTMIERAAQRMSLRLGVFTPPDSPETERREPTLLKVHGSFPFTGDPPDEPPEHHYRLLYEVTDVWLMNKLWAEALRQDLADREVLLFGYRGADPDLTPALLEDFALARSVTWWEFRESANFARLEEMLRSGSPARVVAGNPSTALQELAHSLVPHNVPAPIAEPPRRPAAAATAVSYLARAQLLGQFRGSAVTRENLRRAIVRDPPANRGNARYLLLQSAGYDLPWARVILVLALSVMLKIPRLNARPRIAELYAVLIDARPSSRTDRRAIKRLLRTPNSQRAEILVRAASVEKLHGDLDGAVRHATEALEDLRQRSRPALEAMAVYNLAWTYRQAADFEARHRLRAAFDERMAHIGFNWAAWLAQDDLLLALNLGDLDRAREVVQSPFLAFARSLIRHPMYELDSDLNQAILLWHEKGPEAGVGALEKLLAGHPISRIGPIPFTVTDALIAFADSARALGNTATMEKRLTRAARRSQSRLQDAKVDLVRHVAASDSTALRTFAKQALAAGLGLIARTAEAAALYVDTGSCVDAQVAYRPDLPLAGIY